MVQGDRREISIRGLDLNLFLSIWLFLPLSFSGAFKAVLPGERGFQRFAQISFFAHSSTAHDMILEKMSGKFQYVSSGVARMPATCLHEYI